MWGVPPARSVTPVPIFILSQRPNRGRRTIRPRLWVLALALGGALSLATATSSPAASGTWERAWGKDVISGGGTGFEICTSAPGCKAGSFGGLGGEMDDPEGVATDSSGNVYVADTSNRRIQKFDSNGLWERAWGKDVISGNFEEGFEVCTTAASCKVGEIGGLGGEMRSPAGVATDASGNVYVADTFNHRIQKFDSDGEFVLAWGKDVHIGGGTDFEPCDNRFLCKEGTEGGLGGEMDRPRGVATDASGDVYVADQGNHRIQKFDPEAADFEGLWKRGWGKDVISGNAEEGFEVCETRADCKAGETGGLGGEMSSPFGVGTDDSGDVYVADQGNHRIQKFDSNGEFDRAWGKDVISGGGAGFEVCTSSNEAGCKAGETGGLGGEMNLPLGVATDASGDVYVGDHGNLRIQKFDSEVATSMAEGEFEGLWERAWGKDVVSGGGTGFEVCTNAASCKAGSFGGLGGEMSNPRGVATDASANVYLADQGNQRIQKFADPPPGGGGAGGGGGSGGGTGAGTLLLPPPPNDFDFGKLQRNKKKGIAFLIAFVPGPGEIGLAGKGVATIAGARSARTVGAAGPVKLKVKPGKKGKRARKIRRALKNKGKARVKVLVTFVPTGGFANTRATKVKLLRR
jgi:DNA-binding beta-propeller fold protein YncE